MSILVSVVVPIYNAEQYLEKCLDTIVNQSLKNIEIILVDDGSTDNSANICKKYLEKDTRIVYYHKKNEGLAAARQDGMDRANGEYVGFVDSDDWLELDMYEKMYTVAKQNSADIVFCNCFENDNVKVRPYFEAGVYDRKGIEEVILPRSLAGLTDKGANSVIRWCNWLRIYKMSLIKEHGLDFGRQFRRSQDLPFTFETTLYAQKYVYLGEEYLYHNRVSGNENSLSRGYTQNYWTLMRPLIDRLYQDVRKHSNLQLQDSMALCTFFFAVNGLQNECDKSRESISKRIKKIKEILEDKRVIEALSNVPKEKLNPYYHMCANALQRKNSLAVYTYYKTYKYRFFWKEKVFWGTVRKILNHSFVEQKYVALRKYLQSKKKHRG